MSNQSNRQRVNQGTKSIIFSTHPISSASQGYCETPVFKNTSLRMNNDFNDFVDEPLPMGKLQHSNQWRTFITYSLSQRQTLRARMSCVSQPLLQRQLLTVFVSGPNQRANNNFPLFPEHPACTCPFCLMQRLSLKG